MSQIAAPKRFTNHHSLSSIDAETTVIAADTETRFNNQDQNDQTGIHNIVMEENKKFYTQNLDKLMMKDPKAKGKPKWK